MPTPETDIADDDVVELGTYVQAVTQRWQLVVVVPTLLVVVSLVLSLREPAHYEATADLQVHPEEGSGAGLTDPETAAATARQRTEELRRFASATTRRAVAKVYAGPLDPRDVHAGTVADAPDLVRARVVAPDATESAELLRAYVTSYVRLREQQQLALRQTLRQELHAQVADLEAQLAAARAPLTEVERQLAAHPGDTALLTRRDDLSRSLSSTLTPLDSRRAAAQSRLDALDRAARTGSDTVVSVVRPAVPPTHALGTDAVRDASVALVLGLLAGIALALVVDALDDRIRGAADLERVAHGLPLLATVPEVRPAREPGHLAVRDDPTGPVAAAYRSLRAGLAIAAGGVLPRVIQVTSPTAGDGKTTAVANLALALAEEGRRVLVLGCDLRRPSLHERFQVDLVPGLTEAVQGAASLDAVRQQSALGIEVVAAGAAPNSSAEVLATEATARLVRALAESVDVVLLDCAPVLPVTDALVVSRLADATVVIADARSSDRKDVRETLEQLQQVGAPVVGLVLNGVRVARPIPEPADRPPVLAR